MDVAEIVKQLADVTSIKDTAIDNAIATVVVRLKQELGTEQYELLKTSPEGSEDRTNIDYAHAWLAVSELCLNQRSIRPVSGADTEQRFGAGTIKHLEIADLLKLSKTYEDKGLKLLACYRATGSDPYSLMAYEL